LTLFFEPIINLRNITTYGFSYEGRLGLERVLEIHGFVDVD
jgi:hypothetical protein